MYDVILMAAASFLVLGYLRGAEVVFSTLTMLDTARRLNRHPIILVWIALTWPVAPRVGEFTELNAKIADAILGAEVAKAKANSKKRH